MLLLGEDVDGLQQEIRPHGDLLGRLLTSAGQDDSDAPPVSRHRSLGDQALALQRRHGVACCRRPDRQFVGGLLHSHPVVSPSGQQPQQLAVKNRPSLTRKADLTGMRI